MKNTKIEIRIEEKEKITLQKILSEKGISVSNFLRDYIKEFIQEEEKCQQN
jgi:antitoxin component of RelBE/YafQ-DinJ toxin-antitoxin module